MRSTVSVSDYYMGDWKKTVRGINLKHGVELKELVDVGNEHGMYDLLKNNCTHTKERIMDKAGVNPNYGK
jgi:hypothetical protein